MIEIIYIAEYSIVRDPDAMQNYEDEDEDPNRIQPSRKKSEPNS